jgi:steroid 5-alpha reductase family enzyme
MNKTGSAPLILFPVLVFAAALFAWAGSQGSSTLRGIPIFGILVWLAILIQWLAFIPAYRQQTEKFYDLTGSITYLLVATLALVFSPGIDARAILLWILVVVWAVRLGSFLFRRIQKSGRDGPTPARKELDHFAVIGFLVWTFGFGIEVIADSQKSRFNSDPACQGRFIQTGLWSRSRHPNYLGEIMLWIGVTIIVLPLLQGWQWVALVSPLFASLLLTCISAIPLLEQKADQKWGSQAEYEAYKKTTPVLNPRLCRRPQINRF